MKINKAGKETFFQSIMALMLSQIFIKILGLFNKLYLTNKDNFGDEGNAITSASFQVYSLLLSITSIGVPGAISKLVAERSSVGDHKGAYKIFKISLALFSIVGILGSYFLFCYAKTIANNILRMPEVELSLIALSPSIFLVSIISVYKGYFNGREKMSITAKAQTYDQLTKTFFTIFIIEIAFFISKLTGISEIAACANLATTFANVIEFGYLYFSYNKELPTIKYEIITSINYREVRMIRTIKDVLLSAIPMALSPFIGTIGKNIDSTTIMSGLQNNMSYENAKIQYGIFNGKVDTLINFPLSFSGTLSIALIPSIAAAKSKGKISEVENRINLSLLIGLIIALPTVAIFAFYSEAILKLLFPNASSGSTILSISSFSIIFIAIEQTIRGVLIGIGNNKIPLISITLSVFIKYILNKFLIPLNGFVGGINGAAISNLISHAIATILCYIWLKREINIKIRKINIIKVIFATIIFIVCSKIIYNVLLTYINIKICLILSLLIGIIIYFFGIIIFKVLDIKQLRTVSFRQKKRENGKNRNTEIHVKC